MDRAIVVRVFHDLWSHRDNDLSLSHIVGTATTVLELEELVEKTGETFLVYYTEIGNRLPSKEAAIEYLKEPLYSGA